MKYFALAMVAVLAMASVSMAGTYVVDLPDNSGVDAYAEVSVTPLDFGLTAYDVHIYGTKSFVDLAVAGDVHQVFAGAAGSEATTPYLGQLPGSFAPPSDPTPFDTHFLFASTDVLTGAVADAAVETSTMANEQGLTADYTTFGGVLQTCWPGMGTFDSAGTDQGYEFTFGGELNTEGYDIIRVVLKSADQASLVGLHSQGQGPMAFDVPLGVPEPGTIVMLIAGALCLLGIRRK